MPRRHKRDREKAAADAKFLGDDYKFSRDEATVAIRAANRRRKREEAMKRSSWMSQDWTKCIVPDCRFQTVKALGEEIEFPICSIHAAAVWESIERHDHEPWVRESLDALAARRDLIRAERDEAAAREDALYREDFKAGRIVGDIYFVRIGELIKVGWSSNLSRRIKQYGASVEILCHYSATREDETTLHRQLRPALAKGREWYEDGAIIQHFIDEALAKYGPPASFDTLWTQPKRVVAGKRAGRSR